MPIPIPIQGSSSTNSFPHHETSSYISEDISLILIGLLEIIQRSTIELKSFIESEQERAVLCEALRKALYVTEFLVREKKNRKQIGEPADVIWFRSLSPPFLSSAVF